MRFEPASAENLCTIGANKIQRSRKTRFSIVFAAYKVLLNGTSNVYNMLRYPARNGDFHIKRVAPQKYIVYYRPPEPDKSTFEPDNTEPSESQRITAQFFRPLGNDDRQNPVSDKGASKPDDNNPSESQKIHNCSIFQTIRKR